MDIKTLKVAARQMLKLKKGQSTGLTLGVHYAWIIIVIAAFMHMAGGSIRQTFGVLIVPFEVEFGWSPASSVLAYSLASIVGALLAPISGIATDRYGARKVILVGIVFYFFGAIFTGFASQVWHIWLSFGLGLGVAQAAFNVPILAAATYWFRTRLGLGIGLLQASHGVGPAVMVILVSLIITSLGWQFAFLALGTLSTLNQSQGGIYISGRCQRRGSACHPRVG